MTNGEHERAKRLALQLFDEWLSVTGLVDFNSGYYGELTSLIEDAVDIGAKMALKLPINLDDYRDEN